MYAYCGGQVFATKVADADPRPQSGREALAIMFQALASRDDEQALDDADNLSDTIEDEGALRLERELAAILARTPNHQNHIDRTFEDDEKPFLIDEPETSGGEDPPAAAAED